MSEINPLVERELRSRMRGPRAYITITGFLGVISLVALLLYLSTAGQSGGDANAGPEIGRLLFWVITIVGLVLVALITPVFTAGSIVGERERQTLDLLITSLLSSRQIVLGKLVAALAFIAVLILSIAPIISVSFMIGGVTPGDVIVAFGCLAATGLFYAAIGLFWSSIARTSIAATTLALGTIVMILLGVPFVVVIVGLTVSGKVLPEWLGHPAAITVWALIIDSHPFVALALSLEHLAAGGDLWLQPVSGGSSLAWVKPNVPVTLPSPWLMNLLVSLGGAALLLRASARALRPTDRRP
jgi:ABC-type transport system involved in multi-copper enzyme maturation permease subunit